MAMVLTIATAIGVLLCVHPGMSPSDIGTRYDGALLSAASVPYNSAIDVALAAYYAIEYPRTPASVAHACARHSLQQWMGAHPARAFGPPPVRAEPPTAPMEEASGVSEEVATPSPSDTPDDAEPITTPPCTEILAGDGGPVKPRREQCVSHGSESVIGCTHGRVNHGNVFACVPPAGTGGSWHT